MQNPQNDHVGTIIDVSVTASVYVAGFMAASQSCTPIESAIAATVATGLFYAGNKILRNPQATMERIKNMVYSPIGTNGRNTFAFFGNRGQSMNFNQQPKRKPQTPQEKIQRLDQLVAKSLMDNQVAFTGRRVVVSPRHLTIQFALSSNDEKTIKRAKNCLNTIQMNTRQERVRVYTNAGYFCVELANPEPRIVYSPELRGSGVDIPLGISSANERVSIDFATPATPHLGLPGPTGTGKSQTARNIAYHLAKQNSPNDVRFVVIGQKYEDWKPLECLPHMMAFVSDTDEIIQALAYLAELTAYRSENLNVEKKPRIFIFLDDTIALLKRTDGAILNAIEYISAQGRAPGIHLIFGTQDWTNEGVGSGVVKANVKARVSFGAVSTAKAVANTGRGGTGAHLIQGMGDCLYVLDSAQVPTAAAMVTNEQILELATKKYGSPRPNPSRPWKSETVGGHKSATKPPPVKAQPERKPVYTEEEPAEDYAEATTEGTGYPKLANREPNMIERAYLRELFAKFNNKREVMRIAWGGVVSVDGKTPKTQRWLDNAISEGK